MNNKLTNSTMKTFKNIEIIGITRDFNTCDCCGKTDLSKTVAILDKNHGVVSHYGVVCAAAADKYDSLDAMKAAKKEISKASRKFNSKVQSARAAAFRAMPTGTFFSPEHGTLEIKEEYKEMYEALIEEKLSNIIANFA